MPSHPRSALACLGTAIVVVALVVVPWQPAPAATFTVNPTRVSLSAKARSALLTLKNTSDQLVRFQLDVVRWHQNEKGEMSFEPATEIVFFPKLVTLAPRQERTIRLGTTLPSGSVERAFRIFIEELPPTTAAAGSAAAPGEVRILTRVGIPIFVEPGQAREEFAVNAPELRSSRARFELRNGGNVHVVPVSIKVRGYRGPDVAFEQDVQSWYILAGGTRVYEVVVPRETCATLSAIGVDVELGRRVLSERADVRAASCEP